MPLNQPTGSTLAVMKMLARMEAASAKQASQLNQCISILEGGSAPLHATDCKNYEKNSLYGACDNRLVVRNKSVVLFYECLFSCCLAWARRWQS